MSDKCVEKVYHGIKLHKLEMKIRGHYVPVGSGFINIAELN